MVLVFPTMLAQSVAVGFRMEPPPALALMERPVKTGLLDREGKTIVHNVHFASERIPFGLAVQLQMEHNRQNGLADERFGQEAPPRIVLA